MWFWAHAYLFYLVKQGNIYNVEKKYYQNSILCTVFSSRCGRDILVLELDLTLLVNTRSVHLDLIPWYCNDSLGSCRLGNAGFLCTV